MPGIKVEKPLNILEKIQDKNININQKDLSVALIKAGIRAISLKWESLAESGVDISAAFGVNAKPGEVAYFLITRSFASAIDTLLTENQLLLTREPNKEEIRNILIDRFDSYLENDEIIIGDRFYNNAIDLPFVGKLKTEFANWLKQFIDRDSDINNLKNRFPAYFISALNEQWLSKDYNCLKERLNTPFSLAEKQAFGWLRYHAWLQKLVEESIFTESFSLKQIYVDLRSYYKVEAEKESNKSYSRSDINEEKKYQKVVVNLDEELEKWLEKADSNDGIRLLTGGPGSGKSSFAKIFAAKIAKKGDINVLYIPLHRLEFAKDLIEAVASFIDFNSYLIENPLDSKNANLRLFIIFDGLDELSMQGKIAAETARNFVDQVFSKVELFNLEKTRLQVLITGREVVIEAHKIKFKNSQQLLYLLPYFIPEAERENYINTNNLLAEDQRQIWWQKYGRAIGKNYPGLPAKLNTENLTEITAQPLLNYLVAFAFDDSDENNQFKFTKNTKLNQIYQYLLERVYQRDYEKQGNQIIKGISQQNFINILQEIAISSWHRESRSTTVSEIEKRCENSGLKGILESFKNSFQDDSKTTVVTRFLIAFYFRESDRLSGSEKTFEFTHKSFSEFLTAKRIVTEIIYIHKNLERPKKDCLDGFDEREALIRWATLCGKTGIDRYIFNFILDEISLIYAEDRELISNWQLTLCRLIEYVMANGMPMEGLKNRPNFKEEMRQSRNAEEALLIVLNACARNTRKLSNINWGSNDAFGTWISRLQGQRLDFENILAFECLSFLNLQNCILKYRDFNNANFCFTDLTNADLTDTNFHHADLSGADLCGADLSDADLCGADLCESVLDRSDLIGTNFSDADLSSAQLFNSNLLSANLSGANLSGVNLSGANLSWTDLSVAIFEERNFGKIQTILWNENTNWKDEIGLEEAINVPEELKKQLGLE
ncbi:MAG: pentapeptide repeat-containing protein [Prochloraceae cyanobacterium]